MSICWRRARCGGWLEQWLLLASAHSCPAGRAGRRAAVFEHRPASWPAIALKVLVIDGSYDGYKPTDKSRFDRARQLAGKSLKKPEETPSLWW
jgi:hypothetical protein